MPPPTDERTADPVEPRLSTGTRGQHIAAVKQRALAELDADPSGRGSALALASLCSDLRKHPATVGHAAIELGAMLALAGHLSTAHEMRKFIDGIA